MGLRFARKISHHCEFMLHCICIYRIAYVKKYASCYLQLKICKYLIENGADVDCIESGIFDEASDPPM